MEPSDHLRIQPPRILDGATRFAAVSSPRSRVEPGQGLGDDEGGEMDHCWALRADFERYAGRL